MIILLLNECKKVDIYKVIARNIKKYRLYNQMTQEELARKSGYSYPYIRRVEGKNTPKNFSIQTLYEIAVALNIDIKKLFDGIDIY